MPGEYSKCRRCGEFYYGSSTYLDEGRNLKLDTYETHLGCSIDLCKECFNKFKDFVINKQDLIPIETKSNE